MKMTAPGAWEVEQVVLQDEHGPATYLRVKQHGFTSTHWPNGGYCRTPAEVASVLGDAFSQLVPA